MAGNGALELSIRIMGKVDPSLVTAIKQTKGLTGDLVNAIAGTKSLGSTVANTLGVIGKTGLGIMATLTASATLMTKKTTDMAEEYQAQAADAVKYVGGIMNDDGSVDPEKTGGHGGRNPQNDNAGSDPAGRDGTDRRIAGTVR